MLSEPELISFLLKITLTSLPNFFIRHKGVRFKKI